MQGDLLRWGHIISSLQYMLSHSPTASLMSALWVSDHTVRRWYLQKSCGVFERKYDQVENQILDISCMDDLLSGKIVYILDTVNLSNITTNINIFSDCKFAVIICIRHCTFTSSVTVEGP